MMKSQVLYYVVILAVAGAVFTGGCAREPVRSTQAAGSRAPDNGEYVIGAGDVLQVSVWKNETLSRTVPVRPDGMISLPLVDEVRAAGRTPAQLRAVVRSKLAQYVPTPEVSVMVTEMSGFSVSVLGEVRDAGRYQFTRPVTVLEALAEAGGITEYASPSKLVILRPDGGDTKRIRFDYERVIKDPERHENFYVQPGDIIVVQ